MIATMVYSNYMNRYTLEKLGEKFMKNIKIVFVPLLIFIVILFFNKTNVSAKVHHHFINSFPISMQGSWYNYDPNVKSYTKMIITKNKIYNMENLKKDHHPYILRKPKSKNKILANKHFTNRVIGINYGKYNGLPDLNVILWNYYHNIFYDKHYHGIYIGDIYTMSKHYHQIVLSVKSTMAYPINYYRSSKSAYEFRNKTFTL